MKAKFNVVKADITTAFDRGCNVIVHGCNCHGVMGAGVAKSISDKWPFILTTDKNGIDVFTGNKMPLHSKVRLGNATACDVDDNDNIIFNLYTQFDLASPESQVVIEWDALEKGLTKIFDRIVGHVAMPEIGCGLAGGNVEDFYAVLDRVVTNHPDVEVTIFRL